MKKSHQTESSSFENIRLTLKDSFAMLLAFIQVLFPYILISLGVFSFLTWFLVRFWVTQ